MKKNVKEWIESMDAVWLINSIKISHTIITWDKFNGNFTVASCVDQVPLSIGASWIYALGSTWLVPAPHVDCDWILVWMYEFSTLGKTNLQIDQTNLFFLVSLVFFPGCRRSPVAVFHSIVKSTRPSPQNSGCILKQCQTSYLVLSFIAICIYSCTL